jgi:hypothetical protein
MAKKIRMRFLLFFAIYVSLSTIAVARDYNDPSQSKTCPICFMRSSLASAVGEVTLVLQVDDHPFCLGLREKAEPFWSAACVSGVSYRGPPLSP